MPKENPLLLFYRENNISPVHQDIENLRIHLKRREKLYIKLGIPPLVFSNRTILEIGPGGGHNALAFFSWGAKVDFVEPNPKAQEEISLLMNKYGVEKSRWHLFPGKVEDYPLATKYDVVIAEGIIPGIYNQEEILGKIAELINPGGMVVVTCVDEISLFFEVLKRLIAFRLSADLENLTDKVKILSQAFASHLQKLQYASRPVQDWVTDQFLNPALHADLFSIDDCVREFGEQFELLGSSPSLFTDLSWYKDTDFDFSNSLLEQLNRKRHILLLWNMEESERNTELNDRLFQSCSVIRKLEGEFEIYRSPDIIEAIIEHLHEIIALTNGLDSRIAAAINEVITLLKDDNLDAVKVAHAANFAAAFGRGQQYVSMVRKFTT